MKNGVAALAHYDKTGLDRVRMMKNLLGWMANDDHRLYRNRFFFGAFANRPESLLVALAGFFKKSAKLRVFSGLGWLHNAEQNNSGLHSFSHRQRNVDGALCMRRCVIGHQDCLNSNKNGASHNDHLTFFSGYWRLYDWL